MTFENRNKRLDWLINSLMRDNAACMLNLDNILPIQRDIATTFQEIAS